MLGPGLGPVRGRILPEPRHREDHTEDAGPYRDYFSEGAGERGCGYRSFPFGTWHIVALKCALDEELRRDQEDWLGHALGAS